MTLDIDIPLQMTEAHSLPPSILVLSQEGKIGVRTVDEKNRVRFIPVDILTDSPQGVWVSGLPETVRVISVGQEYVSHNQLVRVDSRHERKKTAASQVTK